MSENAVSTAAKKAGEKVKVTFKTITDPARRRDLRNRITGEPDAEYPAEAR